MFNFWRQDKTESKFRSEIKPPIPYARNISVQKSITDQNSKQTIQVKTASYISHVDSYSQIISRSNIFACISDKVKFIIIFELNYWCKTNAFYGSQNVLGWSKCFVPDQKFIYILWQSQTFCTRFAFSKIGFCTGTKVFEEALDAVKFLGWLKKFGTAQNILGPVKGPGISFLHLIDFSISNWPLFVNVKTYQQIVKNAEMLVFRNIGG